MIAPVPIRLQRRVTERGGRADNGLPIFRIIRGCDRFTHIGGRWKTFDDNGNATGEWIGTKECLKYPEAKDRYILEVLCPPENYGSELVWETMFTEWIDGQKVETLGPFPRQGEYEIVKVIEREYRDSKGVTWKKEFVPLTPTICDAIVDTAIRNRDLPERIKKEAKRAMFAEQEKAEDDKLCDKIRKIEEARPEWAKNEHVIMPSDFEISKFS